MKRRTQRTKEKPLGNIGFNLFRVRKSDGTLGSLFINRQQRLLIGTLYEAECHPTPGYALRPGWHLSEAKSAPHLSLNGRQWYMVEFADFERHTRPKCQGGEWIIAKRMRIIGPCPDEQDA